MNRINNLFYIFIFLFSSCKYSSDVGDSFDYTGFWDCGSYIILITDSLTIHPFTDAPGFFQYQIEEDTFEVIDPDTSWNNSDFKGKISIIDSITFSLERDKERLIYKKLSSDSPFKKFNRLFFETGYCDGKWPVFRMTLMQDGKLFYEGIANTKLKGNKELLISEDLLNQLNQFLNLINIDNYPDDKLSPPAGNPRINMLIEYDDHIISIDDGLFEDKYYNILKYFFRFETLISSYNEP
ncbi:hypothetical protein KZP23_06170 [Echinicola marina]|uniref:DUF6438 domain-containing protein n=1 Tax=Echinicola marina TaxID=2859768 RepID=UPI001CF67EAE|nr:DUF6438 domain-containing protein [Echinicola marina]UCS94603.1 hypothetical protein KZP23_06170 [Echinicola marina]